MAGYALPERGAAVGFLDIVRPAPLRKRVEARDVMERYLARDRQRAGLVRWAFLVCVVLPTALASVYYGLWAADRYVSEARFVVRGVSSARTSGLDLFFRTFGISRAVDDTNVVQNYMLSRDAVRALDQELPLRQIFGRPEADRPARYPYFWRGDSFEALYDYYLRRVSVVQDPAKGITALRVTTFRPEDSLRLAQALTRLAEAMVNRMNQRAETDAVSAAESEVNLAQDRLIAAETALTDFRNRELVVDPSKNSASVVETITSLSKDLADAMAQIQQLTTTSPANPAIREWQAKADALKTQISAERAQLGGTSSALAAQVSSYERLTLIRDLAEKSLTGAEVSLEAAREEARRQQVYIEEIVRPNLADKSTQPERLRRVATVFILCFGSFAMIWILFIGAREHGH
jgi:capsular polysaccharide transport system permease protein